MNTRKGRNQPRRSRSPSSREGQRSGSRGRSPNKNRKAAGGVKIAVGIRVRPPLPREIVGGSFHGCVGCLNGKVYITTSDRPVLISKQGKITSGDVREYGFDYVFSDKKSTEDIFKESCMDPLKALLSGKNGTILTYGQTGTGKTFTMSGDKGRKILGIVDLAAEYLFQHIGGERGERESANSQGGRVVYVSYLQIYRRMVTDLLGESKKNLSESLKLREDSQGNVFADGLKRKPVTSLTQLQELLAYGNSRRATASTKLNSTSSRSHAIITFYVKSRKADRSYAKLHLVDLAGSERVKESGVTGQGLGDATRINLSLFHLLRVIQSLTQRGGQQTAIIPYKDSKLTYLLKDSLGGTSTTCIIATISPAFRHAKESESTLGFALSCSRVTNTMKAIKGEESEEEKRRKREELEKKRREEEFVLPWKELTQPISGERVQVQVGSSGWISALVFGKDRLGDSLAIGLHGYPSCAENQSWIVAPLLWAGYKVVMIDMPGCGLSVKKGCVNGGRTLKTRSEYNLKKGGACDIVVEVIRYFATGAKSPKAVVYGYDWGGGICLSLAKSKRCRKFLKKIISFHPSYNEEEKGELSAVKTPTLLMWCKEDQFHSWSRWKTNAKSLQKALKKDYRQMIFSERDYGEYGWRRHTDKIHEEMAVFVTGKAIRNLNNNKKAHRRLECESKSTTGSSVTRKDNIIFDIAREGGDSANDVFKPLETEEEAALKEFIAAWKEKRLRQMFAAAVGSGGSEKQKALSLFGRLPLLSPSLLRSPNVLLKSGLWESSSFPQDRWRAMRRSKRYVRGRRLLVRVPVQGNPKKRGYMTYGGVGAGETLRNTHRAFYHGVAPGKDGDESTKIRVKIDALGSDSDDEEGKQVEISVDRAMVLKLNHRHKLPYDSKTETLTLEDGLKCRYKQPITKAKMCEIALELKALVNDENMWKDDSLQCACVRRIRKCLNIITFQRGEDGNLNAGNVHSRNFSRYCGNAAELFAVSGQGHCHTVSSVMAAFLYPWQDILGIDLRYRGGFCFTPDFDGIVQEAPENHQWLEFTARPSMNVYTTDLYRSDGAASKKARESLLATPAAIVYTDGLYPHGKLMILTEKQVTVDVPEDDQELEAEFEL